MIVGSVFFPMLDSQAVTSCYVVMSAGYGYISGLQTEGYAACPVCRDSLQAEYISHHKKVVYMGNVKYLPHDHDWREDPELNRGESMRNTTPIPARKEYNYWRRRWGRVNSGRTEIAGSGMTRWSILFDLPYWKVRGGVKIKRVILKFAYGQIP